MLIFPQLFEFSLNVYHLSRLQDHDLSTVLPNYEQAIAQGMKQPPPPYYQVALTTASVNSPNGTETIAVGRLAPPAYTVVDDAAVTTQPDPNENTSLPPQQSPALQTRANESTHTINLAAFHPQL